jgi:protein O-mannosyl-transferase
MKNTLALFLFLIFTNLCSGQIRGGVVTAENSQSITRNLALVVGISSYPNLNRLLYADDDANLFADYLINEKICDKKDVTILIDSVATKANFFKELRKLLDRSGSNDRVFIYFAGHGDVENDIESGFLLTYNCEPNNYPATDAIDISMLEKFVGAFTKKNTKVVLITDACRSGNLAGGIAGASSTINSLNKGFQNVIKILSCQPNQLSQEKYYPGGGHGVFTYHLIDGLSGLADKDNDQYITLRELDRYLDEVADETKQQQVPKTDGDPSIRIAGFNPQIKEAILARKSSGTNSMVSTSKTRGSFDSSWLKNDYFMRFNEHVRKKRFISPEKNNALYTIGQAKETKGLASMVTDMQLELSAILEDLAQEFINKYLRGSLPSDQKLLLSQLVEAKEYINILETLTSIEDFRYNEIHVKKLFFDAYYIFKRSEKNKYGYAVKLLEEANRLSGNQAWIYNAMGLFYEDLKMGADAENCYKKATVLAPQWSYPWNNLGMYYWKKNQLAQAESAYNKSIELDSTYGFAWNGLGNVLDEMGKNEEAVEAYKKSIEFNPYDDDPWNGLGNVLSELNRKEEAKQAYLKAIALDSLDAYPWNGLGNIYLDLQKLADAEASYKRSILLDSLYMYPWNNMGILKENQGKWDEAAYYYKKATLLDSNYFYAWSNLGSLYLQIDDHNEAATAYKKAVKLSPRDADSWNGLGLAFKGLFRWDEARDAYLRGIEFDPNNYHLWFNLGIYYKEKEQYTEASNAFKKTITLAPLVKKHWDYLLKMLELAGDEKELLIWQKNKSEAFPKEN